MKRVDLERYEGKNVNVIFANMKLKMGILKKIPFLPLWKVDGKIFKAKRVSRIYEVER